jgi:hypothetical protein
MPFNIGGTQFLFAEAIASTGMAQNFQVENRNRG